jgi:PAS domain S-box-containing protein
MRYIDVRNFETPQTYTHLTKSGRRIDVEILSDEIEYQGRPAWISIVRDITERKRAEIALQESEEKFRSISASAQDAIIMIDSKGKISYWNRAAEEIFGYTRDEVIGNNAHKLIVPERFFEQHLKAFEKFQWSGKGDALGKTLELFGVRKNGVEFPVELSLSAVKLKGQRNAIAILRDITERKQAEEELRKAKEAAEEANRAKSEFLANMSHEIRTPLNAIIGMTELILETELNSEQKEYANVVQSSSETLLSLINDILDLSKIEAGQMEIEQIPFNLRDVVEGVAEILSLRAQDKRLEFNCYIEPCLPDYVKGDPTRLRQILINLVGNAIKFTETGEVSITVESMPTTNDNLQEDKFRLHFVVSDTGVGISKKEQKKIFTKFSQADSSTTRKYGGTGLGLSIANSLVELMDGRMWLESKPGRGSTFHFSLCLGLIPDKQNSNFDYPDFSHVTILVVDDNITNLIILQKTLKAWGFRVKVAQNSRKALTILQKAHAKIDLILLDHQMPEMDGVELARSIRKNRKLQKLKIIMLSSWGGLKAELMQELDIAASVTKPVRQSRLLDTLMIVLRNEKKQKIMPSTTKTLGVFQTKTCRRILIVEDNMDNQNLAKRILQKAGYLVDLAENGQQGVEAAQKFHYDLILMDIQMPVLDGFGATHQIRDWERKQGESHVPIIAVTAHAIAGYLERCLQHEMNDYITKPLRKKVLLEIVDKWIDPRPTILVVDDSKDNSNLIKYYLEREDECKLIFAQNGQEALDVFQRHTISLILMDMEMPILDGYKATRAIRKLEKNTQIPIIALTAHQGRREINKCLEAGCTTYLSKPIKKQKLLRIIHQHFDGLKKASESLSNHKIRSQEITLSCKNAD